tara:strand:- start:346 stop:609 length:264 start_codon:yes stop_codon:yes gene_type:complete
MKRKEIKDGVRKWAMITYAQYVESGPSYSMELDECNENDVFKMLEEYEQDVNLDYLVTMGWKGINPKSGRVIEIFHDKTLNDNLSEK